MIQEIANSKIAIMKPSAVLLHPMPYFTALDLIEEAARNCYQSNQKPDLEDKEKFIRSLIKRGHESPLEHVNYSMRVVIDRGILAEWTRHRIGSAYSVESTRYVNYAERDNYILMPSQLTSEQEQGVLGSAAKEIWMYQDAIKAGCKPEQARALLPQCLVVRMVVTHNIRQWRHVFKERLLNAHAHMDFRRVLKLCLRDLYAHAPVFFEDVNDALEKMPPESGVVDA